ncbi:MAG: hypothetical protein LBO67_00645 [Spirochaetaceae bacterium]|jgi:hypothetical protein|nr:hypothetical protein [Spirochaetaceae bacterium]
MFSDELKDVIIKTLTSWQLLSVCAVLTLYFLLVSYVAKLRIRRRVAVKQKEKEKKPSNKKSATSSLPEEDQNEDSEHDGPKRRESDTNEA